MTLTAEQSRTERSLARSAEKRRNAVLTAERLREVLHYDPSTGIFTCRVNRRRSRAGSITGAKNTLGYIQVVIDWKIYLGHRLAWLYMTGEWPDPECDHENLDQADNRWINLRRATRTQNSVNKPPQSNNTSGFKGVAKSGNRWRAYIGVKGKQVHLGVRKTPEEAHALYVEAAQRYYGEFARAA